MKKHPAQFSTALLDILTPYLIKESVDHIHDPFAGTGLRLGQLCDDLDKTFTGTDIENWEGDTRVSLGDSLEKESYPTEDFIVVTSPAYANGISDHFEPKDNSTRRTYRVGLGQALNENNTGRYSVRAGKKSENMYWTLHDKVVKLWAVNDWYGWLNVSNFIFKGEEYPLVDGWKDLLTQHGYEIQTQLYEETPRYRYGENRDLRSATESWLKFAKENHGT